jgi:4-hydroxyphenylpyruvate dioxygenase
MGDLFENPLGTDGFAFVEYTAKDVSILENMMEEFGFKALAKHKQRDVILYKQGEVIFLLNKETTGQPARFCKEHDGGANAMGFKVHDAEFAYKEALSRGAEPIDNKTGSLDGAPAIKGIGGSRIYFIDNEDIFSQEFEYFSDTTEHEGVGLTYIDHLTHNLKRGNMGLWASFYEDVFNFREIRYFDIEGKLTGLISKAMTSPCGKIRIPLNESSDDKSQIEEFLQRFNGEGIQHIALGTNDIFQTVSKMKGKGVVFQDTPLTYYENIDNRVPGHGEDIEALKESKILIDGAPTEGQGILLQIFTQDEIGPVFFEIIQRKGNEGFGEGNFQALFESIEQDQINRGVLTENG